MNRIVSQTSLGISRMPHVCGDEPINAMYAGVDPDVCPTYVGMNRFTFSYIHRKGSMPHVCGDEPDTPWVRREEMRMPHVCGDEPIKIALGFQCLRMPHVCGDEPPDLRKGGVSQWYAPRMWG